jgi:hypothetical protein
MRTVAILLLFFCSTGFADDVVKIPLDQIWANRMPGTLNINDWDTHPSLILSIQNAIGFPPKDGEADPAFAVQGESQDALREAHAVIVDKKKPRGIFPAGKKVSVVFFTHETGPYVHLYKVERRGKNIDIHYKFVPHEEEDTERHIALIPLGKLPVGEYSVNIIRSKKSEGSKSRQPSDEVARRIVCRPFSFTVSE